MLIIVTSEHEAELAPDPKALRALAHPLRWRLIDLLGSETSATATRCADVLGESVASCSYHLGILAKYGYIELVPDQPGREKPWRLTSVEQNLSPAGSDAEVTLAAEAATEVFLDHELSRMKYRLRRRSLEPPDWRAASRMLGVSTWMTSAELHEISDGLIELLDRYYERAVDPASRPAGAREVRLFAATSVAPPVTPPRRPSSSP
jgi:hypothetical protein